MISILVPVLGRAQQIKPLLQSIADATSVPHHVILICSPNDSALPTALASKAETLVADWPPERGDYAKKLTLGYHATNTAWLFQGATDLYFHPGWDTHALALGNERHRGVVGTNDLGNPSVIRGRQSTHSLISRYYLDTFGGTADDSGGIFSETYDHQFTDIEFVETAKRRRQFVFARDSIVEHLHPLWGKGEYDPTYEKALRDTAADQQLFLDRRHLLLQQTRHPRRR